MTLRDEDLRKKAQNVLTDYFFLNKRKLELIRN